LAVPSGIGGGAGGSRRVNVYGVPPRSTPSFFSRIFTVVHVRPDEGSGRLRRGRGRGVPVRRSCSRTLGGPGGPGGGAAARWPGLGTGGVTSETIALTEMGGRKRGSSASAWLSPPPSGTRPAAAAAAAAAAPIFCGRPDSAPGCGGGGVCLCAGDCSSYSKAASSQS